MWICSGVSPREWSHTREMFFACMRSSAEKELPWQSLHFTSRWLDAAQASRSDLPFACKGGVCGTCRARVVDGEVAMRRNFALEDDEVAAGFVARGIKAGALIHATRVAVTGQAVSPGIFEVLELVGRERAVARLSEVLVS